jgi:hypothetical protein
MGIAHIVGMGFGAVVVGKIIAASLKKWLNFGM